MAATGLDEDGGRGAQIGVSVDARCAFVNGVKRGMWEPNRQFYYYYYFLGKPTSSNVPSFQTEGRGLLTHPIVHLPPMPIASPTGSATPRFAWRNRDCAPGEVDDLTWTVPWGDGCSVTVFFLSRSLRHGKREVMFPCLRLFPFFVTNHPGHGKSSNGNVEVTLIPYRRTDL